MALVSEQNFVQCQLWFHFIWNLAEKKSQRGKQQNPTFLVYVLSPATVEADYELIMSPYEANTLVAEVFMCFDVLLQYYIQ